MSTDAATEVETKKCAYCDDFTYDNDARGRARVVSHNWWEFGEHILMVICHSWPSGKSGISSLTLDNPMNCAALRVSPSIPVHLHCVKAML